MNETELLKTLSSPAAMALAILWLNSRLNRLENKHDAIAVRLGMPHEPRGRSKVNFQVTLLILGTSLLLCIGCASVKVKMDEVQNDGTQRHTEMTVRAIGDAQQTVNKLHVSLGKTQSAGAGVDQEVSTTNAASIMRDIRDIVVALPK